MIPGLSDIAPSPGTTSYQPINTKMKSLSDFGAEQSIENKFPGSPSATQAPDTTVSPFTVPEKPIGSGAEKKQQRLEHNSMIRKIKQKAVEEEKARKPKAADFPSSVIHEVLPKKRGRPKKSA